MSTKIQLVDQGVYLVRFKDGMVAPLAWLEEHLEWSCVTEGGLQYPASECAVIKFLYHPNDYER